MKALFVAALLVAMAPGGPASASTIRVDYTGTVASVNDPGHISGYSIGEAITGEMVLALPDTPQRFYMSGVPFFDEYDGTGASTINGSTISGSGSAVNRSLSSFSDISFGVSQTIAGVQYGDGIYFGGSASVPLLGSLKSFPTDLSSIETYLQSAPYTLTGQIVVNAPGAHLWDVEWNLQSAKIAPVNDTPIPATLPLFATALGGLGFACRRRSAA